MLAKSTWKLKFKIQDDWDFPGGPVVKNSPSNAGDVGLIPGQKTEILHTEGQLNLCSAIREFAHRNEAPTPQQRPSTGKI